MSPRVLLLDLLLEQRMRRGKKTLAETVRMSHYLLLVYGRACQTMKQCGFLDIQVGIAQQGMVYYPETENRQGKGYEGNNLCNNNRLASGNV